jgi:hypothetical protein
MQDTWLQGNITLRCSRRYFASVVGTFAANSRYSSESWMGSPWPSSCGRPAKRRGFSSSPAKCQVRVHACHDVHREFPCRCSYCHVVCLASHSALPHQFHAITPSHSFLCETALYAQCILRKHVSMSMHARYSFFNVTAVCKERG